MGPTTSPTRPAREANEPARPPGQARHRTTVPSPLGPLTLVADDGALVGLYFDHHHPAPRPERLGRVLDPSAGADPVLATAAAQLDEYFAGRRTTFDLPLRATGTPFQRDVWAAIAATGYGTTTTYAAIAVALGRPTAVRAVGAAVGRNPLSIVVPCHRVVGSAGLTGYAGGLDRKRYLLRLEDPAQDPPGD